MVESRYQCNVRAHDEMRELTINKAMLMGALSQYVKECMKMFRFVTLHHYDKAV